MLHAALATNSTGATFFDEQHVSLGEQPLRFVSSLISLVHDGAILADGAITGGQHDDDPLLVLLLQDGALGGGTIDMVDDGVAHDDVPQQPFFGLSHRATPLGTDTGTTSIADSKSTTRTAWSSVSSKSTTLTGTIFAGMTIGVANSTDDTPFLVVASSLQRPLEQQPEATTGAAGELGVADITATGTSSSISTTAAPYCCYHSVYVDEVRYTAAMSMDDTLIMGNCSMIASRVRDNGDNTGLQPLTAVHLVPFVVQHIIYAPSLSSSQQLFLAPPRVRDDFDTLGTNDDGDGGAGGAPQLGGDTIIVTLFDIIGTLFLVATRGTAGVNASYAFLVLLVQPLPLLQHDDDGATLDDVSHDFSMDVIPVAVKATDDVADTAAANAASNTPVHIPSSSQHDGFAMTGVALTMDAITAPAPPLLMDGFTIDKDDANDGDIKQRPLAQHEYAAAAAIDG